MPGCYRLRDTDNFRTVGYGFELDGSGVVWVGIWMDPKRPVIGGAYPPVLGRFNNFDQAQSACNSTYGVSSAPDFAANPIEVMLFRTCMNQHRTYYLQHGCAIEYNQLNALLEG